MSGYFGLEFGVHREHVIPIVFCTTAKFRLKNKNVITKNRMLDVAKNRKTILEGEQEWRNIRYDVAGQREDYSFQNSTMIFHVNYREISLPLMFVLLNKNKKMLIAFFRIVKGSSQSQTTVIRTPKASLAVIKVSQTLVDRLE